MSSESVDRIIRQAAVEAGIEEGFSPYSLVYKAVGKVDLSIRDRGWRPFDWEDFFHSEYSAQLNVPDIVRISKFTRNLLASRISVGSPDKAEYDDLWSRARRLNEFSEFKMARLRERARLATGLIVDVNKGSATDSDVAKILSLLSDLYKSVGGSGIVFDPSGLALKKSDIAGE